MCPEQLKNIACLLFDSNGLVALVDKSLPQKPTSLSVIESVQFSGFHISFVDLCILH